MDSKDLRNIAEAYTLTKADKTGNTPAWQNRDKVNPKTGEPIYTKADHLRKEELEATGIFTAEEIEKIIQYESVGSAVDKTLSATADVAKVAGKAAVGGVKVASKVVKGAAKTAAHVAGTPIGAVKAIKKGFKSGSSDANESYEPAVLNALSALDTYMQSNDHLHGSVLAKKK